MREQMFLEEAESPGAWEAEEITHAGTQWYSTPAHTVTHPVLQKPPEGLQKGQDKAGSSQSTTPLPCSSSPKCTPKAPTRRHNFSRLLLSAATAEMDRNLSSRIFLPVGNWKATLSLFGGKGQTEALHCFLSAVAIGLITQLSPAETSTSGNTSSRIQQQPKKWSNQQVINQWRARS